MNFFMLNSNGRKRPSEAAHVPIKLCSECHVSKSSDAFTPHQFKKKAPRRCKDCTEAANLERKRQREESKRLLSLPRPCSDCGLVKRSSQFSGRQWKISMPERTPMIFNAKEISQFEQRCLDCYPRLEEQADLDRQEAERMQPTWDAEWGRMESQWAKQRRVKRIEHYDFPTNEYFSGVPNVFQLQAYEAAVGPGVGLLGKYQIIYHHGESAMEVDSLTFQNSFLTLEMDKNNELTAVATFDPEYLVDEGLFKFERMMGASLHPRNATFCNDFRISFSTDSVRWLDKEKDWCLRECLGGDVGPEGDELSVQAGISVVEERIALPWLPQEMFEGPRCNNRERDEWLDPKKAITFETLEEADELVEAYEKGLGRGDWLCNHEGLTPDLVKHIYDFVAWRPRPVIFLEPGDVVLDILWCEDHTGDGDCNSCYVARKIV